MSSLSNTKIQSILVKLFLLTSFFFPWQLLQPGRGEYYIIMCLPNLLALGIIITSIFSNSKIKITGFNIIFSILILIYILIALFYCIYYHQGWYWDLINKAISFLMFLILMTKCENEFWEQNNIYRFLMYCIISSCLLSIAMYFLGYDTLCFQNTHFKLFAHGRYPDKRLSWVYPHKGVYALLLLLYTAFILQYRKLFKSLKAWLAALALTSITLFFTASMTALAALALIYIGYIFNYIKWKSIKRSIKFSIIIFISIIIIPLVIYILKNRDILSLGSRLPIWKASIKSILSNPNGIALEFENYIIWGQANNCHNIFLNEALRFSIPVGISYTLLHLVLLCNIFNKNKYFSSATCISIFMLINIDFTLKVETLSLYLFMIFILFFSQNKTIKKFNN